MQTIAWNIKNLVNQYNYLSSGHFFDKNTMRFFRSRLTENYKRISDKEALFITTEQGPSGERKATIRRAKLIEYTRESDGFLKQKIEIITEGDFNSLSLHMAKKILRDLTWEKPKRLLKIL